MNIRYTPSSVIFEAPRSLPPLETSVIFPQLSSGFAIDLTTLRIYFEQTLRRHCNLDMSLIFVWREAVIVNFEIDLSVVTFNDSAQFRDTRESNIRRLDLQSCYYDFASNYEKSIARTWISPRLSKDFLLRIYLG